MKIKSIFFILIVISLLMGSCSKTSEQAVGEKAKASDFSLMSIDGKQISLQEVLKNKAAVLAFWTTWCIYCRKELPRLEEFYLRNKDKVEVIGIDIGETKAQVEKFIRRNKLSYPIVIDADARVAKLYNVRGVPVIVAVGKDGGIEYYGYSTDEMLEKTEFYSATQN